METRSRYVDALNIIRLAKRDGIVAATFRKSTKTGRSVKVCYQWAAHGSDISRVHEQLAAIASKVNAKATRGPIYTFTPESTKATR